MKIGVIFLGAALAQIGEKSEQEIRDHFRTEEEANEFLKWRREKYQRERQEERRDRNHEIMEDQREFERTRGSERRSKEYERERQEERFDQMEEEREHRREEQRRRNRDL
ncbi:unnamed protein product [Oikopleura dioica]|uniref:Uncharacterized protein n=1 Tax=Oikopleura dioica TaxID=34765 RepID=E4Y046_OIKDI|nr:unnamed protein product [Oikopleura dioica]